MQYVYLAIIMVLVAAATALYFLWRNTVNSAESAKTESDSCSEKLTEIATEAVGQKESMQSERDWYKEECLRLQGANQRLSELIYSRKSYEKMLDAALDVICIKCESDKTINETTGIPDACVGCSAHSWRTKLNAMKGVHENGADAAAAD